MPRVSVLLTSYNKPQMLDQAINSVLNQTYQDFELIILEDNSPQLATNLSVTGVVASYWTHPRVVFYKSNIADEDRRKTVRYATQINVGLKIARGHYITYLCDDDLYLPQRLEKMVARLDEGDCQVVYGAQKMIRDDKDAGIRPTQGILDSPACVVDHSSVMHTRAAAIKVGGWDDNPKWWAMADAVFWTRLAKAGYHFYPIDEALDVHRYHGESVSGRVVRGLEAVG